MDDRYGLTPYQMAVLKYLRSYIGEHGFSPSYREIAAATGSTSTSKAHRAVRDLQERGWIRSLGNRSRSIRVVKPREE